MGLLSRLLSRYLLTTQRFGRLIFRNLCRPFLRQCHHCATWDPSATHWKPHSQRTTLQWQRRQSAALHSIGSGAEEKTNARCDIDGASHRPAEMAFGIGSLLAAASRPHQKDAILTPNVFTQNKIRFRLKKQTYPAWRSQSSRRARAFLLALETFARRM